MLKFISTFTKISLLGTVFFIFSPNLQAEDLADNEQLVAAETKPKAAAQTPPPANIDCSYHIEPQTTQIDPNLIIRWAEKAAQQSFDFEHSLITTQLDKLKLCYTDLGWQSYNEALTKSGNLEAIKKQQLIVSSIIDGQSTIVPLKTNQWKVTVPMQVVYQNAKEKITQKLTIDLVVGRKTTGDLGIVQMIASPRKVAQVPADAAPAPAKTSPLP